MDDLRRVANWLLVGLGFQVLDIRIQGFDVVPDVVGAVLIAVGAFVLADSHPGERRDRAGGPVKVLAGLALAGTLVELVVPEMAPWYVLTSLLFAAVADMFAERCEWFGRSELARKWEFNRNLTLVVEILVAVVAAWVLAVVVAEEFAILGLLGFWPFVHRVVLLFTVRRAAVATVTAQPAPDLPLG